MEMQVASLAWETTCSDDNVLVPDFAVNGLPCYPATSAVVIDIMNTYSSACAIKVHCLFKQTAYDVLCPLIGIACTAPCR